MLNTRPVAGQKLLLPTEFINKKKIEKTLGYFFRLCFIMDSRETFTIHGFIAP